MDNKLLQIIECYYSIWFYKILMMDEQVQLYSKVRSQLIAGTELTTDQPLFSWQ